eukprot:Phypoly_transcript_03060.p1 GENE.Phypoly_transcript_03060~~Phypoly_transcript_03060.p1  ORF type:complete len:811 (-),score=134.85 Phypoly_transcript_03060:73-2505(-)
MAGGVKTRTVLVLDCSEQCAEGFDGNDVSLQLKNGTHFSAKKSILTACVEGLVEYCRIIYDLFPDSNQVSVVASGDKPFLLNGWNFSEQSLKQILREFAYVRPEITSNVQETLELAVQTLIEPTQSSPHVSSQCKFRIVLVLQAQRGFTGYEYQDGQNVIDVAEVLNFHLSRLNKSGSQSSVYVPHCELLILRLTETLNSTVIPSPPKSVGRVLANLQFLHPSLLFDGFSDLAQRHHSVGRLRVSGIPMRETIPEAERTLHDAVLLYDASSQNVDNIKGYNNLGTTKRKEIVVKWKSPDQQLNPDTLPCKSTHRITPQIVSSFSSTCLMRHVCSGHPVYLVTPGSSDSVSHALLLQGPEVVLHMLHASTPTEGLPLQIYSGNIDIYRVKEFVEIVDANILQHRPKSMKQPPPLERVQLNTKSNVSIVGTVNTINSNPTPTTIPSTPTIASIPATPTASTTLEPLNMSANVQDGTNPGNASIGSSATVPVSPSAALSGPNSGPSVTNSDPGKIVYVLAPKNLERYTRYFPWTEGDSLLYNSNEQCEDLRRLLDPFKRNMLKEYLNEEYVDTITELINRMFQFANANELRLFPNLGKSAVVRKDAYKKLWSDCHNFAQVCSSTPNHAKMVTLMERLWPEACGLAPPPPPTPSTPTPAATPSTPSLNSSQPLPAPLNSSQQQPVVDEKRRASYQEISFVPQSVKKEKEKAEADTDVDMWSQLEQSKKNVEEAELQAERERQMLATMSEEFRNKKRKQHSSTEPSGKVAKTESVDNSTLFAKYWASQASKNTAAAEFDGQIEGDQFKLYADLNK